MKKTAVPDAWDDDWEVEADKEAKEEEEVQDRATNQGGASLNPVASKPLTKAERITLHEETNRQAWQSA